MALWCATLKSVRGKLNDAALISRALQRRVNDAWVTGRDDAVHEPADEALEWARMT
jgi:hypothetical protein